MKKTFATTAPADRAEPDLTDVVRAAPAGAAAPAGGGERLPGPEAGERRRYFVLRLDDGADDTKSFGIMYKLPGKKQPRYKLLLKNVTLRDAQKLATNANRQWARPRQRTMAQALQRGYHGQFCRLPDGSKIARRYQVVKGAA